MRIVSKLTYSKQYYQACQKHQLHHGVQYLPLRHVAVIPDRCVVSSSTSRTFSILSDDLILPNSTGQKNKWTNCEKTVISVHQNFCRNLCTDPRILFPGIVVDKYNGVTVDLNELPADFSVQQFQNLLTESLQIWRSQERSCIWIKVPIDKSSFISVAAQFGFQFHHSEHQMSLLKLWLDKSKEDKTPRFATHQIGVSDLQRKSWFNDENRVQYSNIGNRGMVYREDTKEILVVKDKASQFTYWKFPGGLSDLEEDISETAEREVLEETGIKSEFLSVLAMRQQHQQPGAFGRSDIFIVCRLKPLTFDIDHCQNEISHCQWMDLKTLYINTADISPITHRMCQILLHGIEHDFQYVDIVPEEMKSVYKGLKYKLYHRPM